ncbi:hypothetical protein SIAM614_02876 [Stappia aggregata IAM 12614]|uniref:Uncharacterized protein n=1 Tax=Roseibium aggregatum (strain ATCC 25650 / DSM 13394 / JCM 20685 / NBRC 16684 / NCIMB 2208 / IAM 12614 / B1) TaxID=384765 RepID=A0NUI4_ROSAI|nr:hypothetical protein SIAM614_02876 [Stappia aggregata IAM 12614] [Roseibium aggregatum IAM 12614]
MQSFKGPAVQPGLFLFEDCGASAQPGSPLAKSDDDRRIFVAKRL